MVKACKTPVPEPAGARAVINSINVTTYVGLSNRVLIGLVRRAITVLGA
jgi:hypothetical protein